MSSMRDLFARRGIREEIISLRNSLNGHVGRVGIGLREAMRAFPELNTASGFDCGCREPDSIEIGIPGFGGKDVAGLVPSWVSAGPRDHRDGARKLEGILVKFKITKEDFPLKPWHTFYDWNFFVRVDNQYRYLLNQITRKHHSENLLGENIAAEARQDIIECEWDSAFVPLWALPQVGGRVVLLGRWIFDCGHPENDQHRMELHPVKALVSYRSEAATLKGNNGPTRANNAVVFIGRKGGYFDQPINDQDYEFDLYLPPRPHASAEPTFLVRGVGGATEAVSARLPVFPVITPIPANNPKFLHVVIPLKAVTPAPDQYGAIISAGWTDPTGTSAVKRVTVTLTKVTKLGPGAPNVPIPPGVFHIRIVKWLFYFGVNGRWHKMELDDVENTRNISVTLDLHSDDQIHVTACGSALLQIHQFMGRESGVPARLTSEARSLGEAEDALRSVRSAFLDFTNIPGSFSNIGLNLYSQRHSVRPAMISVDSSAHLGPPEKGTRENDYRLEYSIRVES